MAKFKAKSHSFGGYGNRVRVFRDPASGYWYGETADPSLGCGRRSVSLRTKSEPEAIRWGKAQSEKLAGGYSKAVEELRQAKNLFELYAQHGTQRKSPAEQNADARRSAMWLEILGDKMDLSTLSPEDWEGFLRRRTSGEIDANGKDVEVEKRRKVRPATAGADAAFLKGVCHFGSIWRVDARYILDSNPCRGFEIPGGAKPAQARRFT